MSTSIERKVITAKEGLLDIVASSFVKPLSQDHPVAKRISNLRSQTRHLHGWADLENNSLGNAELFMAAKISGIDIHDLYLYGPKESVKSARVVGYLEDEQSGEKCVVVQSCPGEKPFEHMVVLDAGNRLIGVYTNKYSEMSEDDSGRVETIDASGKYVLLEDVDIPVSLTNVLLIGCAAGSIGGPVAGFTIVSPQLGEVAASTLPL
jgi:hypothetical protein